MPQFIPPLKKYYFSRCCEHHGAVESIGDYKTGGYHPVHLGDTLPTHNDPRYRILHKLGCGSFSTVWLAKDTVANICVALKIVVARLTEGNGEAAILERLTTSARDHPGASHIVQLYDYFQIQGPNGTHQVLVMDVLASASSLRGTKLIHQQSRSVCHQLLLGLDFLQQEAVVHGDLQFGNIGFKIPGIDQCTEDRLLERMGHPVTTPVVPRDHSIQCDSLPKYLVDAGNMTRFMEYLNPPLFAQIMDFGNAFWLWDKKLPLELTMRANCRAPELTIYKLSDGRIKDEWGFPSDVWSMACTIFETVNQFKLFKDHGDEHDMVYDSGGMDLFGPMPERWKPYLAPKPYSESDDDSIVDSDTEWQTRLPNDRLTFLDPVAELNTFVDLLSLMFRWEPMDRPSVTELLKHPWFSRLDQAAWFQSGLSNHENQRIFNVEYTVVAPPLAEYPEKIRGRQTHF